MDVTLETTEGDRIAVAQVHKEKPPTLLAINQEAIKLTPAEARALAELLKGN